MCIFFFFCIKSPEGIPPRLKERQVVTPSVSTLTVFTQDGTTYGFARLLLPFFNTLQRISARPEASSVLSSTFLTSLIPRHSAAPSQRRGHQSFREEKSGAFSARWVSCNMFDLLRYLQKVSLMKECIWGCFQICASKKENPALEKYIKCW